MATFSAQESAQLAAVVVDKTILRLVGVVAQVDPIVIHHLLHLPLGCHAKHLEEKHIRIEQFLASHIGTQLEVEELDDFLEEDFGKLVESLAGEILRLEMF